MSRDATVLDNDKKLKRDIGIFATGFLVLNGVIGAGILGFQAGWLNRLVCSDPG